MCSCELHVCCNHTGSQIAADQEDGVMENAAAVYGVRVVRQPDTWSHVRGLRKPDNASASQSRYSQADSSSNVALHGVNGTTGIRRQRGGAMHLSRKSILLAHTIARTALARGCSSTAAFPPPPPHPPANSGAGASSSGGSGGTSGASPPPLSPTAAASLGNFPGGPGLDHFLRAHAHAERLPGGNSDATLQVWRGARSM